ncbi:MAG TPA: hypothetical protein VNV66_17275 [Pilimelia sp.]|nr:hypothetical protein [Pilimelia sp.]
MSSASRPRRRLRSATVHLGAMTVLALGLSGCNGGFADDDDDDCGRSPVRKVSSQLLTALPAGALPAGVLAAGVLPAAGLPAAARADDPAAGAGAAGAAGATGPQAALPGRGGFGTHLAYGCGG